MKGGATPSGVQNERTALAWQRTALSLVVASAALARLAYERIGYPGLLCLVAIPASLFVFRESRTRYRRRGDDGNRHARGGIAGLTVAAIIIMLCLTSLAIVLRW